MDITHASPDQFAAQIKESYPFHFGIRDLYARFRENPGFQQTRGLIRLMRTVVAQLFESERAKDLYLIHAHDINLNDRETVGEITQINPTLDNAISHDIASQGQAIAEVMDANMGGSDATTLTREEKAEITTKNREKLQKIAFERLSYDEKLAYCDRPEQIENLDEETWAEVNEYLGTNATSLQEFVRELGEKKFGHTPRVGDAFADGGSVPFEAARIGCEASDSDLNPVAALLTWVGLNIVGGGEEVTK